MTTTQNALQTLTTNFEQFKKQATKLSSGQSDKSLFQELESDAEQIMLSPASTRYDLVCAYPGGLIEHSLRVLSTMAKMRSIYDPENKVPVNSIILVALFHDIGKAGNGKKSYYLDNDSEWHRTKLGQMYTINEKLAHLPVSQLSLEFLIRNGFTPNSDEWYAISSIRDKVRDDIPVSGEPMLAVMLQHAVKLACIVGKNKKEVSLVG